MLHLKLVDTDRQHKVARISRFVHTSHPPKFTYILIPIGPKTTVYYCKKSASENAFSVFTILAQGGTMLRVLILSIL